VRRPLMMETVVAKPGEMVKWPLEQAFHPIAILFAHAGRGEFC
jgi:hypothetical protein